VVSHTIHLIRCVPPRHHPRATRQTLRRCFASDEASQNSSQHARALDRDIKRVTETAWDQAVNDTANLWQSILWNALGPERAWQEYGIPAP
jgi:hypothetical protein